MGREIKFRAYNAKHSNPKSRMILEPHITPQGRVIMPDGDEWELPLMEYIGLKDKSGIEIYEGDIFEVTAGDGWVIGRHLAKMDGETLSIDERCIGSIVGTMFDSVFQTPNNWRNNERG